LSRDLFQLYQTAVLDVPYTLEYLEEESEMRELSLEIDDESSKLNLPNDQQDSVSYQLSSVAQSYLPLVGIRVRQTLVSQRGCRSKRRAKA
jgi:hypothetical protein